MLLLILLFLNISKLTFCEKFYIYTNDKWDKIATASHHKRDTREILNMSLNHGAGEIISKEMGIYHTDQYHMYDLVYYRLLKDSRRTLDPDEATSFFVPYDLSLDCAFYKNCARSKGVCFDFRKCPLAPKVEKLLKDSKYFKRNNGKDHFAIVGMNYAMDHFLNKPLCKSFLLNTCTNCTKWAIDDYSFLFAITNGVSDGVQYKGDNWAAAPFPSDFHFSSYVKPPFPWEINMNNNKRNILVAYIGTKNSYWGPARRLRGSLVHYCDLQKNHKHCVHVGYGANGTRSSMRVEGHKPHEVAQRAIFCFQPFGDLLTRKGLFDNLLMGCIPVVFHSLTATSMYVWHWSEQLWNDVVVFLPAKPISFRYSDPIEQLRQLAENKSFIEEKQKLIKKHVFKLQWSLESYNDYVSNINKVANNDNDNDNNNNGDEGSNSKRVSVSSGISHWPLDENNNPLPDAFETIITTTLGWHSGRLSRKWPAHLPAEPNPCWTGRPNKDYTQCEHEQKKKGEE